MKTKINRRGWLKKAGISSSAALLGSTGILQAFPLEQQFESSNLPSDLIRLSANENPYGPSGYVRKKIAEGLDYACRYPSFYPGQLLEKIAAKEGVSTDSIVLTAGSTEGLKMAGLMYGMAGSEIVAATPTFLALMTYAAQFGATINYVPLDEQLAHDLPAMERAVTNRTSLVYLCNPNNPTGTLLDGDSFMDFGRRVSQKAMVFIDEAYIDYIRTPNYPTGVSLVKEGAQVIVAKTFSKVYGLAGMRIGYLVTSPKIASSLKSLTMGGMNIPALFAAEAALEDQSFYEKSLALNEESKEQIYQTLDRMGLRYIRTHGNFVFFKSGIPIRELQSRAERLGVLVGRPFPPYNDWCRISTGTPAQTDKFCSVISTILMG